MREMSGMENKDASQTGSLITCAGLMEVIEIGDVQICVKEIKKSQVRLHIRAPRNKKIENVGVFDSKTNQILRR